MKTIKNEYNYNIFYEVDDFSGFADEATLEDFEKIDHKKVCFVDEEYNILIVEFDKNEKLYKYKDDNGILLLVSGKKYFELNWGGSFMNVLETSADEYEIEMLDKIRSNNVKYFTTQF